MLVLTRKIGERIWIGKEVVVTVLSVQGHRVRLGIEAPASVPVRRDELAWKDMGTKGPALSCGKD
jgi:carbon storage regulator